jgi:hypothetical protein
MFEQYGNGTLPKGSSGQTSLPQLEIMICPSNPPATQTDPVLSYVANSGFRYAWNRGPNANQRISYENPADGIFFDRTRMGNDNDPQSLPSSIYNSTKDARDWTSNSNPGQALQLMTLAYLQGKGDGTTKTMLLSESTAALYYTYGDADMTSTMDASHHFGFNWVQPGDVTPESKLRINGSKEPPPYVTFAEMSGNSYFVPNASGGTIPTEPPALPRVGMPSSTHPGGVNVAFVAGHVTFVGDQIEPLVYAQLMTSNHKQSSLGTNPAYETTLPEPADGSF